MNNKLKKFLSLALVASMMSSTLPMMASATIISKQSPQTTPQGIKNVIFMIPDGTSVGALTLSRYMLPNNEKGDKNLSLDPYITALVKTRWADGPITDSAPAGTAYSTGKKSINGALGIDENKLPRATLLEASEAAGKSTGLVTTCEFMHATPGAFGAHVEARSNYPDVSEQMLNNNIDVVLSAGFGKVEPSVLDLRKTATAKGYEVVETKQAMDNAKSGKIWGNFDENDIPNDFDRTAEDPSLSEMTKKAIDTLSKNDKGFFLMVEGSKIDWEAHSNNPVGVVSESLAYDKAFQTALDFAKGRKDTVVLSVTDHGNSGISIGNLDTNPGYDSAPFSILDPLKGANKTEVGAMALLNKDKSNTDEVLKAYGINPAGYTAKETDHKTLKAAYPKVNENIAAFKKDPSETTLAAIMSTLCFIGFTTGGHTGEDVPLYVYAPDTVERPTGLIDNTDVSKYAATCLGLNLDKTTKELFVEVSDKAFPAGSTHSIADRTLTVKKGGKTYQVKANQSIAKVDSTAKDLKGVAIELNGKFYVPQSFIDLIK